MSQLTTPFISELLDVRCIKAAVSYSCFYCHRWHYGFNDTWIYKSLCWKNICSRNYICNYTTFHSFFYPMQFVTLFYDTNRLLNAKKIVVHFRPFVVKAILYSNFFCISLFLKSYFSNKNVTTLSFVWFCKYRYSMHTVYLFTQISVFIKFLNIYCRI